MPLQSFPVHLSVQVPSCEYCFLTYSQSYLDSIHVRLLDPLKSDSTIQTFASCVAFVDDFCSLPPGFFKIWVAGFQPVQVNVWRHLALPSLCFLAAEASRWILPVDAIHLRRTIWSPCPLALGESRSL